MAPRRRVTDGLMGCRRRAALIFAAPLSRAVNAAARPNMGTAAYAPSATASRPAALLERNAQCTRGGNAYQLTSSSLASSAWQFGARVCGGSCDGTRRPDVF